MTLLRGRLKAWHGLNERMKVDFFLNGLITKFHETNEEGTSRTIPFCSAQKCAI
jgi:hypothetical protein